MHNRYQKIGSPNQIQSQNLASNLVRPNLYLDTAQPWLVESLILGFFFTKQFTSKTTYTIKHLQVTQPLLVKRKQLNKKT